MTRKRIKPEADNPMALSINVPVIYRSLLDDEVYACITSMLADAEYMDGDEIDAAAEVYPECVSKMFAAAEELGIAGDIWHIWLAKLIAEDENAFSLAQERREPLSGTAAELAKLDMATIYACIHADLYGLGEKLGYENIASAAKNFVPTPAGPVSFTRDAGKVIGGLASAMEKAETPQELFGVVADFYHNHGAGKYGLYPGFRWDEHEREIVPALPLEDISLDDLIGYESQKETVIENTEAFLEGRPANNVLLYGEGGTGKSSTIKAILNKYAPRGLRMIEVYKHQIVDLATILDEIKRRNYRFILFMDDLSFEEFEVEYKFLKAFIEGGLERRPENVLIYATSNRRHLMKETWHDREDKYDDDVHQSETMQEKLSLVDRFGLLIRYISPEQREYLNIVTTLAAEYGINIPADELEHGAIRWELKHGGFSGRSARQYVEYLAGHKKNA